ncbi:MAG: AarF/ABC1/UbiB kinase family protein [Pseudomonadota bacterium]
MTASVMGGMAWNGARRLAQGERPAMRELLLTPGNVKRIADDLARMRGAAMKVGQLVSMDTGEMLPPELSEILARLRNEAHFMPPKQLRDVLIAEWGRDWRQAFERFDVKPIAAASIGQVHRARLKSGEEVAVKVQYPGVARSIDSDISNVGALLRMSGLVPKGFEIAPYLKEAKRQLHEETDYLREGAQMQAFGKLLGDAPHFAVPKLHSALTTRGILTMEYLPGDPIETAEQFGEEDRDRIGTDLIALLFRELFEFGLMQTDPNFANYRLDPKTRQIILLDFGATRAFAPEITGLYRDLFRSGIARDAAGLDAAAEGIGFVAPDTAPEHRAQILKMIGMCFEDLGENACFDFGNTDLSRRMNAEGERLAASGFVPPPVPMDVLYLQRKFGGTFLLAGRLRARVPVRALAEQWTAHS